MRWRPKAPPRTPLHLSPDTSLGPEAEEEDERDRADLRGWGGVEKLGADWKWISGADRGGGAEENRDSDDLIGSLGIKASTGFQQNSTG